MAEKLLPTLAALLPHQTAVIGGGGKSTLLLGLGQLLAEHGHSVLLTTTTHVAWPAPSFTRFAAPADVKELNAALAPGIVTVAGYPAADGRMIGIPQELLNRAVCDYIIIEADGSRHLPLKVHRDGEPVIPDGTGLVLQVCSLSALGKTAGEVVHRCSLLGLSGEEIVTPELVEKILVRGACFCNGLPHIHLLNQADCLTHPSAAGKIVKFLESKGERCLYGSLREEGAPCWC